MNSTKSPVSYVGDVSEPRLMSHVGKVRVDKSERYRCQYWSAYVAAAVT